MSNDKKKEAKIKAGHFCAYRERTQQEVRDKLYNLGLHRDDVEEVLSELISEGYINEERFARSYAGGKFRLKKWGRNKIIHELERRKITRYCIDKAMEEIPEEDYLQTLRDLIGKKLTQTHGDPYIVKNKIARYMIGKGYEPELVWKQLEKLL